MKTRAFALFTSALACCEAVSFERRNLITPKNDQVSQATGKRETGHLGFADSPAHATSAGTSEQETEAVWAS